MIVRTQAELTAALANPQVTVIEICSPEGVWLRVEGQRPGTRVVARESSQVEAWGSSQVEAWGSSRVVARESSRVEAWGSSQVVASPHVAIHLHSGVAQIEGGVIIDVTSVDATAAAWAEHHGLEVQDDMALVYKAVDDRWSTPRGFVYEPGAYLTAPDWRDDGECGGGLHFGPTPRYARDYHQEATRYVKVAIPLDKARPIPGGPYDTAKIKAASCLVLGEVTIDGEPVGAEATA